MCRTEKRLTDELRQKLSLFCNIPTEGIIEELDVESIYEVPLMLHREGADKIILKHFSMNAHPCNLTSWERVSHNINKSKYHLPIALVGKYIELQDAYKSIYEALTHGAIANACELDIIRIDGESMEHENMRALLWNCAGVVVPGGFGNRGIEGILSAITRTREQKIPFFGICLGMQLAVIEFARNVAMLHEANSTEFQKNTPHPIIALMDQQRKISQKGGSMRLGNHECLIKPGTHLHDAYGKELINERHRHRYEFNDAYADICQKAGLNISGTHQSGLVEAIELDKRIHDHPWFVGVQFHPEFKSKPQDPHPLFRCFIKKAKDFSMRIR
jgi:CTP synthase